MTILTIQADVRESLNEERKSALAFVLKASRADHGGIIEVATKVLKSELEKAVRNEFSVYGSALRTHKKIVILTLDGKKCLFGTPGASWGEVAKSAMSGLSQIAAWARWRQSNLDALNAEDAAARELILDSASRQSPDMKAIWFARSVGRVFDVAEDIKLANEARKPMVTAPVAALEDLADATIDLAAGNVDSTEELEAHALETLEEAAPLAAQEEVVEEQVPVMAGVSLPELQPGLAATEVLNTLSKAGYWSPSASPEQSRRKLEALIASHAYAEKRASGPVRRRA